MQKKTAEPLELFELLGGWRAALSHPEIGPTHAVFKETSGSFFFPR